MSQITDDYMQSMLKLLKPYTVVLLRATPKRKEPGADQIVWEHGRRLFELRRDGKLCIVCPTFTSNTSGVSGLMIFRTDTEETRKIMDDDPTIRAGIYTYDLFPVEGYPGDSLAK